MKRIVSIIMLVTAVLVGGITADAKTTKKNSSKGSSASIIGKFTRYGTTVNLLSNGKAQSKDKCMVGTYKKINNGSYYKVQMYTGGSSRCGDGEYTFLILGNDVYEISAGSTSVITDFTYNPNTKVVTITEIDGGPATSEELEYIDLNSPNVSLSYFDKLGKITWVK